MLSLLINMRFYVLYDETASKHTWAIDCIFSDSSWFKLEGKEKKEQKWILKVNCLPVCLQFIQGMKRPTELRAVNKTVCMVVNCWSVVQSALYSSDQVHPAMFLTCHTSQQVLVSPVLWQKHLPPVLPVRKFLFAKVLEGVMKIGSKNTWHK